MQQAKDFYDESECLKELLSTLEDKVLKTETLFKSWTIEDVIGHLYLFNVGAVETLKSESHFEKFYAPIDDELEKGKSLVEAQVPWLDGLEGSQLVKEWWKSVQEVYDVYKVADPKTRVKWPGVEMSAKSKITARHMETWAHGHEVFDVLGKERPGNDNIKNIAHMGIIAYGWTFMNRKLSVPEPVPYVKLEAPSGAVWEWNDSSSSSRITGSAIEFSQVVTQVRNIEDTSLVTEGQPAKDWMKFAQCFAGPPMDPPAKGTRYMAKV